MEFTVAGMNGEINFGASGFEEIRQNLRTILSTIAGTVPLDRNFGIDLSPLDAPIEIAKARMTPAILEAVQTYEPRVEVLEVSYTDNPDGRLIPTVKFRLADGVSV